MLDLRLSLLLGCFFLSGVAALLYQTLWTRELSFVFGTSELAIAAVLAAYMGGLALGAGAAARWSGRVRRPVLVYGVLELAIALCAVSVPLGIQGIRALQRAWLGGASELPEGPSSIVMLFQLGAAFAILLPPTALMGATLPLLARHAVHREAEISSRVGVLYAVNTAGAIAGTLCAAYWLMPALGLRRSVWVGAGLNAVVFALAALLARGAPPPAPADASRSDASADAPRALWILPAIALSGFVSFAYEVLWTRLLSHLLGSSLAAFASMLASFLLGIALGSAAAARLATTRPRAALGFGIAQLGIALAGHAAFAASNRLPELSLWLGAGPSTPLRGLGLALVTLLPITLCIGATFPFAVRILARSPEQAANATARVYAWNTLGAIAGALGSGFVLLPWLGFEGTATVAVATSLALAALVALVSQPRRVRLLFAVAAAVAVVVALPARAPWALLGSSPLTQTHAAPIVFAAVGRSSTVIVFDHQESLRLFANGLPEAVVERKGVQPRVEIARMLGLLPALLRPEARELLAIGLGGGTALELVPSSVRSIDVIELEPEVLRANQWLAAERETDPLSDPRVHIYVGDARSVLELTAKKYGAIVSQPSHPWTAGASHLYTYEFFERVRAHLAPGGVFVQWIGLNFVDEALLRSLTATLIDVFGHVEVFQLGDSAGLLFAASLVPLDSLANARKALEASPEELARTGLARLEDFAVLRLLDEEGTRALAEGGQLITDDANRFAARAASLGTAALASRSAARRLWKDHEPLRAGDVGLDRSALIRQLIEAKFPQRAALLAAAADGAEREVGYGWLELASRRYGRAAKHFERARALDPNLREAFAGALASQSYELSRGRPLQGIRERDLDAGQRSVLAGWRGAAANDWDSVAALDAELARFAAGAPLYEEAIRLRIRWRLARPDPAGGAEAQALAERLLARRWSAEDELLRARAALLAQQPVAAWGSLSRVASALPNHPRAAALAASSLEIAKALPEPLGQGLRSRLRDLPRPAAG